MDALQAVVSQLDYAIGDRVNTLMRRRSITRAGLGAALGVGPSATSLKIAGKRAWYAADVKAAAQLLEVSVAVLYGDEPMPEPTLPGTITEIGSRARRERTTDYKGAVSPIVHLGRHRTHSPESLAFISPAG